MNLVEEAIATIGVTGSIAVVLLITFAVLQLIGEFIEAFGKVAPAALKLRKIVAKKLKRDKEQRLETAKTLKDVQKLLEEVNAHYSADNITQRDEWMEWVNNRAIVYDEKVEELIALKESLANLATALDANTRTTDNLFKESCRETIINFSHRAMNPMTIISEEEFRRVFNVYESYERFLQERNEPNGQVENCYAMIREAYRERMKTNNFLEYTHLRNLNNQ